MKKTAIHQLIEELESMKHLTTNPDKKEAYVISIGLAKAKLEIEEQQLKTAFDEAWGMESAQEYYNRNYNTNS